MNNFFLQSERLGFKLLETTDIDYLKDLDSDPEVRVFFPNGPITHAEVEAMINKFLNTYQETKLPSFIVFDKVTKEFIGRTGFGKLETGEIEIGGVLHKKFWNQGYANEILQIMLAWAKKNISAEEIVGYALVDNIGSWRVMEKNGMTRYKTEMAKGAMCHFYKINNK